MRTTCRDLNLAYNLVVFKTKNHNTVPAPVFAHVGLY